VISTDVVKQEVCRVTLFRGAETHPRSVLKAISWRTLGTLDTFAISWFFTGQVHIAGSIAAFEIITKIAWYYLHERVWAIVPWDDERSDLRASISKPVLVDAAGFCLLGFGRGCLGRVAVAAHGAPWIGRALVGNVAERSLVGLFGGFIRVLLLLRLFLGFFPVPLHRLLLRAGRPGHKSDQERDGHSGTENSHPYFLLAHVKLPPSAILAFSTTPRKACAAKPWTPSGGCLCAITLKGSFAIKSTKEKLPILGAALGLGLSLMLSSVVFVSSGFSTAAYSRGGGMGSLHSAVTGGAFGASPVAPGTNSAGTALSSSGGSGAATKGPALGTGDPVVDRQDKEAGRMVKSICRGC
jgi:uncharacterized membrane protein